MMIEIDMIALTGLTKTFDDFVAVNDVTLSVAPGEILALLGPNGAGKTTTVRMLAAILRPTTGRAVVAGHDVIEQPRAVRRSVGLLTEHPGLYLRMRGAQYVDFFGQMMGLSSAESKRRAQDLLARFDMPEAWDRRMGTYSKGMRQKMALVRAMLHDPSVLLLDEPTSAMDPHSAKLVRDAVLSLRHHRRAIVICTHNLAEAELLADRIAIIRRGEIVTQGAPSELKTRLLGPPLMELRLVRPVDGVVEAISQLVNIESYGKDWIRYTTREPRRINPQILKAARTYEADVVTLSAAPQSLEDVYLQVVEARTDYDPGD
jgi:ABC-2 type transport system ATP-binding protein